MPHFAKVQNNIVTKVIVADPEYFLEFVDDSPGLWLQTSYNTRGNQHLLGGTPLRGNFAGIGYIYDQVNDVFYPPKPFPSWVLNTSTWIWDAPIPMPDDGHVYEWNELNQSWDSVA